MVTDYTKPRPGDKVRATLPTVDGVLVAADGQGVQLRLDDGSIHHLPGADIHVLERADDRQVQQQPRRRTFPYEVREWMDEEARVECFSGRDPGYVVHEGVAIGMTEAPTVRVQKDDGQIVSWVIGLTRRAQSDIDELPDWERELLEQEAARPPAQREPRVFTSDGPEPPQDVVAVEWLEVESQYPYLIRVFGGWLWSQAANRITPDHGATPNNWSGAVASRAGSYREVSTP